MNAKYKNALMIVLLLLPSITQAVERKLEPLTKEKKSFRTEEIDKESLFAQILRHVPVKHKTLNVRSSAGGFNPNSKKVVTSGFEKNSDIKTYMWNADNGGCLFGVKEKDYGYVENAYFSPVGNEIIVRETNACANFVYVRDAKTGNYLYESGNDTIHNVKYSPDGTQMIYRTDDDLRVLDVHNKTCLYRLKEMFRPLFRLDDKHIAVISKNKKIHVLDAKTGECLRIFEKEWNDDFLCGFNNDGKIISSVEMAGNTSIWDVKTGECQILKWPKDYTSYVCLSPDCKKIATRYFSGKVGVWDVQKGKSLQVLTCLNKEPVSMYWVNVAFDKKGTRLVTSSEDNVLRIWELKTGTCLHKINNEMNDIVFSPNNSNIIAITNKNSTNLIDIKTGLLIHVLKGQIYLIQPNTTFSPDGSKTITSSSFEKKETYISDLTNFNKARAYFDQKLNLIEIFALYKLCRRSGTLKEDDKKALQYFPTFIRQAIQNLRK